MKLRVYSSKEEIKQIILTSPYHLERAVVAIFERQTTNEQVSGHTHQLNGIGFNGPDSKIGTYMARYIKRGITEFRKPYGKNLSGKFLEKAKKIMPKYCGQLLELNKKKISQLQNNILTSH